MKMHQGTNPFISAFFTSALQESEVSALNLGLLNPCTNWTGRRVNELSSPVTWLSYRDSLMRSSALFYVQESPWKVKSWLGQTIQELSAERNASGEFSLSLSLSLKFRFLYSVNITLTIRGSSTCISALYTTHNTHVRFLRTVSQSTSPKGRDIVNS